MFVKKVFIVIFAMMLDFNKNDNYFLYSETFISLIMPIKVKQGEKLFYCFNGSKQNKQQFKASVIFKRLQIKISSKRALQKAASICQNLGSNQYLKECQDDKDKIKVYNIKVTKFKGFEALDTFDFREASRWMIFTDIYISNNPKCS